jgi:SAM-dependent methyltransferase
MSEFAQIDGYVADTAYPSKLHQSFQAPWIDAVLAMRGIAPPRAEGDTFTLVDMGCGDAIGLILAAASHPHGRFIGVDAIPDHIARGQAVIDGIGLNNITLICGGFADILHLADESADYVTAQGVLAWISADNRAAMLDLACDWLKPGGAFCVGYNAYPGWNAIAPMQALVRAIALEKPGNSTQRFTAAVEHARRTGAVDEGIWDWLDRLREGIAETYFAHEYLNAHWQPCWSGDVITAMGDRGLAYVGQAGTQRLRDDFCYTQDWRAALADFKSVAAREIAADLLTECWFRRDVYIKMPGLGFDRDEQSAYRIHSRWAISPEVDPDMAMISPTLSGEMDFDNAAARAILSKLANGPMRLSDIGVQSHIAVADLLNTIDALFVANRVVPVDAAVEQGLSDDVNRWLAENHININGRATPNGAMMA